MRTRSIMLLTALSAAAILSLAVSSASANNISVSEQNFEVIWSNSFSAPKGPLSFIAGGSTVSCNVTLLGRFEARTLRKQTLTPIARIRHVDVGRAGATSENCTGGSATARTETLPWNVNYAGFSGVLPDITLIILNLIGVRFRVHPAGLPECDAGTTSTEPGRGRVIFERGRQVGLRADETATIALGGGFLCEIAGAGRFAGTALLRNLPNTADLTITLI